MLKKIIGIGVLVIMIFSVGLFSACKKDDTNEEFALDCVSVLIKAEYREKFLAEEFTVEDFEWDNIDRIEYRTWYDNISEPCGGMVVYLKEKGREQVIAAVEHFKTLDFVKDAGPSGSQQIQ